MRASVRCPEHAGAHDDLCNAVAGVVAELVCANSFAGSGVFEFYRHVEPRQGQTAAC